MIKDGMKEELINVNLYGDGSRKHPLEAEYLYCDRAESCSEYKRGKCFNVRVLFSTPCQFGHKNMVHGGSKYSKRYEEVKTKARESEKYNKLLYPHYAYITKIGDGAFLTPPSIRIECDKNGTIICSNPGFGCNKIFVSADVLTPENINKICSYRPMSLMGDGFIDGYTSKTVPLFLFQLSKLFPEKYNALIERFPDYEKICPDFRGRIAELATVSREFTYIDVHGNEFYFDGNELVCDKYRLGGFMPFGTSEFAKMRIPVSNDMRVKITDNRQVTDETVFD